MELDAFTEALGTRQGRLRRDGGHVLVLGDVEAHRVHELRVGDYVEWGQDVDLTDEVLVRVQGSLRTPKDVPPGFAWEVSFTVDGEKHARLVATPGRAQRADDMAASVAGMVGTHRVAVRLELVSADG
jgi:hypothetical protein